MHIWSAEIKELETLYASIKGRFPELEKELERLVKADDENMILLYSRRCLEVIITDLCVCELKRGRGTEPLKGVIDKLGHEKKVPSNIIASMEGLNALSTFGTHPKDFDPEQVKPVLSNLAVIVKWYVKYKDTQTISKAKPEEVKYESKEPVDARESTNKPKKKRILLISGIILVVAIIVAALFIFNVIGGKQTRELDKSIAVLPFVNDSKEEENTYFINGIMEEVLLNLQAIKDLRVPGRTSVEQYRNTVKSIPEIARELGVSYIVEGSGQKYGNTFRLRVQLLEGAKDRHLWGESYEEIIDSPDDIFRIHDRIAESIAAELKAIITPEEKQLIEKIPTTSLTAYDFFQKGREEHTKYWVDNKNIESLKNAESFYYESLKYDSSFARAYTGLAWVYWDKHYWEDILSEDFMDSVLILCDIALSFDDQLSEAYTIRGRYFDATEKREQAIEEFDKAIKFNPNDWMSYVGRGRVYAYSGDDMVKSIENLSKAVSLYRGPLLSLILDGFASIYRETGFMEEARNYAQEAFKLNKDTFMHYWALALIEYCSEDYEDAIEFLDKAYALDTSNISIHRIFGEVYMMTGNHKKALEHFQKWLKIPGSFSENFLFGLQRTGWAYWQNGYKEKGEYYFNEQIKYCNKMKELGRVYGTDERIYIDLASVYAFRGEKNKAFENLKIFSKSQAVISSWTLQLIKNDPLFDSLRDEPEFQQILKDVEAIYQAKHERVRKWMEEQGEI